MHCEHLTINNCMNASCSQFIGANYEIFMLRSMQVRQGVAYCTKCSVQISKSQGLHTASGILLDFAGFLQIQWSTNHYTNVKNYVDHVSSIRSWQTHNANSMYVLIQAYSPGETLSFNSYSQLDAILQGTLNKVAINYTN